MTMTTSSITNAATTDQLRALSQDEINTVAGGLKPVTGARGGLQCFPIFEDDGHGGIIIISPTLGPLGRFPL
jgi:hypothetical protein